MPILVITVVMATADSGKPLRQSDDCNSELKDAITFVYFSQNSVARAWKSTIF